MNNPRLASRYAKSLLDLAVEQNQLEVAYADMNLVRKICHTNPDFVALLKSPVIHGDKKEGILNSILESHVSKLTGLFIQLLLRKTRESNLPEIAEAFINQYNAMKGIHRVKITTAVPLDESMKALFIDKVKSATRVPQVELVTAIKENLIGGFTLEMDGNYIDASILRDLNDVKRQFKSNEYIQQIR